VSRTPEQTAADDALTTALERVIIAYHGSDEAWVLSEYVAITAQHRFDDDGDGVTAVATVFRDADAPRTDGHERLRRRLRPSRRQRRPRG
jgi:hypothetical protein